MLVLSSMEAWEGISIRQEEEEARLTVHFYFCVVVDCQSLKDSFRHCKIPAISYTLATGLLRSMDQRSHDTVSLTTLETSKVRWRETLVTR